MNRLSLSLTEKQLTAFVANDKIQVFKNSGKHICCYEKDFFDGISGNVNGCDLVILVKFVNIWKICTTDQTSFFKMIKA
jgi:hypothetical protein